MDTKNRPEVNEAVCTGCGTCLTDCAPRLRLEGTGHVDPQDRRCERCFHCYAVCPFGAIEVAGPGSLDGSSSPKELSPNALTLSRILEDRRSVRSYSGEEPSAAELSFMLESTRYIPSGGNSQDVTITIVRGAEQRAALRSRIVDYYRRMLALLRLPLLRPLAAALGPEKVRAALDDREFYDKIRGMLDSPGGQDLVFYRAPLVLVFHSKRLLPTPKEDCVLAAYNLVLSAQTIGIGSCFVSLAQQAIDADASCKRLIGLERDQRIHAVVVLGRRAISHRRPAYREPKRIRFVQG
jgi:nitroreductase